MKVNPPRICLLFSSYGFREKNNTQIDFPFDLDLKDYVINPKLPDDWDTKAAEIPQVNYELFAVSNHFGSMTGGHYTAYAKNHFSQKWYNFNDSSVSEVTDESEIISDAAYVLFYRRKLENTDIQVETADL